MQVPLRAGTTAWSYGGNNAFLKLNVPPEEMSKVLDNLICTKNL
jgi:hypothetical protein